MKSKPEPEARRAPDPPGNDRRPRQQNERPQAAGNDWFTQAMR